MIDTVTEEQRKSWLPMRALARGADPGALPVFCLPHAGGSASAYRPWLGKVPGAALLPVQPPGRETRLRDETFTEMGALVEELAPIVVDEAAGGPYAVYGHSLGALVAFELVRRIRALGAPEPVHLFLSGCVAPSHCAQDGPKVLGMSEDQVVDMLRKLGGTPEWLLADPGTRAMIMPAVRADFSVKETYVHRDEPPLSTPITVLASTADPRAEHALQDGWRAHTTGGFELHTMVGGHFAVFEQATLTHKYLLEGLRPWLGTAA
ncbi:thioesterase II family protein [Labedaea rhizosphaerae]|uniref:Surfactin synthase thioesterase subunit n=1 Tax=Labedaea rhizosphaerae TaxID=598644 RepID=A0A4R6SET2_LABRH|nr:thioesterase domain-containing protein [Labedaea rhizosphaerae]TDQ00452.1 surfactin synthase thioesterase subunit [Labedaea rhizosphaerae]